MRTIAFVVSLIVSMFSLIAAISSISEVNGATVTSPSFTQANGFVSGNVARNQAITALTRQQSVPKWAMKAAKSSFGKEPTSSDALLILGADAHQRGETNKARQLLLMARSLKKRDVVTNQLLMADYLEDKDIGNAMLSIDIMMRSNKTAVAPLASVLSSLLITDEAIDLLDRKLQSNPPWAAEFWHKAAAEPKIAKNAGKLRLRQLARGLKNPANNDAKLLNTMVGARQFDLAHEISRKILAAEANGSAKIGSMVHNAKFTEQPKLTPFDWVISGDKQISAAISASQNSLELTVQPSAAKFKIARQLIRLSRGNFALTTFALAQQSSANIPFAIMLQCAEEGPPRVMTLPIKTTGRSSVTFTNDFVCDFYWLDINGDGAGENDFADYVFRQVSIERR